MKELRSDISGFYKLSFEERQRKISKMVNLDQEEIKVLQNLGYFTSSQIDTLIENVVGSYQLPFGLAFNFIINNKDYIIPMVIEEPSVVAAASNAAKFARKHGGFHSENVKSIMISQIQITQLHDVEIAKNKIGENKDRILKIANEKDPILNE
ncbi:MAG: 3-hydroxy-3-methylglutaryl-CoA reductase, partial [Candidatus Hodarchaeota archaeon]